MSIAPVSNEVKPDPRGTPTTVNPYGERDLAIFAPDKRKIASFAGRLRASLSYRGAEKLNDAELLALAAASLAHNLNPFLGEVVAIPGKGLMIGRPGWVKKIDELAQRDSFKWWPHYRLVQRHEWEKYEVPADAVVAYLCEIRRTDWIAAYAGGIKDLGGAGMKLDFETITALMGVPPVVEGVGYLRAGEIAELDKGSMSRRERCEKRAFAQACKKFVPVPFKALAEGDQVDGVSLDEDLKIEISGPIGEPEHPDDDPTVIEGAATEIRETPPEPEQTPEPEPVADARVRPPPEPAQKAADNTCSKCGSLLLGAEEQSKGVCANCMAMSAVVPPNPGKPDLKVVAPGNGSGDESPFEALRKLPTPQTWGTATATINRVLERLGAEKFHESDLRSAISQHKGGEPKPANLSVKEYWLTAIVVAEQRAAQKTEA